MFKFITHKPFLVNLLVIILLVLLLLILFFGLLGIITKHNESQKVPSVTGRTYDDAKKLLESVGLEAGIQDSVYADTAKPSQVMRQSPVADAVVKSGRTVYLTINRSVPPLVEMPDLRGFSIKSATLYLQSLGLKVGDTSYVYDIARNAVKDQLYQDKTIEPGTKIKMGSSIDLVIGNGVSNIEIDVPDLTGMTVTDARALLSGNSIELGAIIALDQISDTGNAFIVNQRPIVFSQLPTGETMRNKIKAGQIIDVWISKDRLIKDSTAAQ